MSVRQVLNRSRAVAWFRHLSPPLQAIMAVVAISTLTAILAVGGLLAFFARDDHQFKHGLYCHAEPDDPLC